MKVVSSTVNGSVIHDADDPHNFEPDLKLSNDIDIGDCDQTLPPPSPMVQDIPEPSGSHISSSYDTKDGIFF